MNIFKVKISFEEKGHEPVELPIAEGESVLDVCLENGIELRKLLGPGFPFVGVGGIDSSETALSMLRVGADLVQVYTGFVYEGPFLPRAVARGLVKQMEMEGATSLEELVSGKSGTLAQRTQGEQRTHFLLETCASRVLRDRLGRRPTGVGPGAYDTGSDGGRQQPAGLIGLI